MEPWSRNADQPHATPGNKKAPILGETRPSCDQEHLVETRLHVIDHHLPKA